VLLRVLHPTRSPLYLLLLNNTAVLLAFLLLKAALLNQWAAKLLQVGREMFPDNAIITPSHEF